jgi:hypothetical protein
MARQARLQRTTRYVALSRGVKKRWMAGGPVELDGKSYTPQEILDRLKSLVDAVDASAHAYASWRATVATQHQLEEANLVFVQHVGIAVRLLHGKDLKALGDFGMEPVKKTGPKTAEVKAAAADKGRATRAKRGTMGKRQRKKAKGG